MIDRRAVMLGLGAGLVAPPALAADESSPVAHGVLANNALAKAFEKSRHDLPDVTLIGPYGEFDTGSLKGRTILMPLWAEWCAPCLSEIPDFARLQHKYGTRHFTIMPVLTATRRKLSPDLINNLFDILHARALKPVVEKNFTSKLAMAMGRDGNGWALPCNLLIAPDGSVVGREMGRISAPDADAGAPPPKTGDPESVTRAILGQTQSLWGKQEGEDFAAAMAAGFLG